MKWFPCPEVCQGQCVEESIGGCLVKWGLQRRYVLPYVSFFPPTIFHFQAARPSSDGTAVLVMQRCNKLFLIHMLECSTSYLISPLIHCHDKCFAWVWVVPKQSMSLLATRLFELHDNAARYSHLCPPLCSVRFSGVRKTLLKQDNIPYSFPFA